MWKAVAFSSAALAAGMLLLASAADAEAHQPEGLRISLSEMPEPPCTSWHEDACETAAPPQVSVNPFQSDNPHDPALNTGSGYHDHHEHLESIAALNQRVLARLADSGDAMDDSGSEPDGPGGSVNYAITSDITGLPWVRDGQTATERVTVAWLSELQEHNPSLVTSLVRMPFLQDHTPGDLQAIRTLTYMSRGTSRIAPNPQYARDLVNRAALADGSGIDNTEAKIIAVMSMQYFDGNSAFIQLLADYGTIEEKTSAGQHGNTLTFAVVRVEETRQNSTLMQSAIIAIEGVETLMGEAFPSDFMGILVADCPDCLGRTNGVSIEMDDRFDQTDYDDNRQLLRTMAHEIGHFWWGAGDGARHHEAWISEGAAEYIGAYSVKARFGDSRLSTDYWPCPYYRTIEHLRADNPQYRVSQGGLCNYSLGERLFINLDRNIGHTAFTAGFRDLHQRLSTYEDDEIDQGLSLLRAFCPGCESNPWNLGSGGNTLARYYGEKVLTDSSAPNGSLPGLGPVWGNVPIVDYFDENRQYGVAQVPASSPDQRRWVQLRFNDVVNPPDTVNIYVVLYHEDREPYMVWPQEMKVLSDEGRAWFYAYLGDPPRRAPGHHWVYIYNEDWEKIAEAEYQVLP